MNNFKYFVKLFIFWLLYFCINRLFFISIYIDEFLQFDNYELLKIFPYSFPLDISFISYLSTIISIILFLNSLSLRKHFNIIISEFIYWVNILFIITSSLLVACEISLYSEWSTKLNFNALRHLSNPSEVFLTATYENYFILLVSLCIAVFFIKLYSIFVHQRFISIRYNYKDLFLRMIKLPIVLAIFLVLIRGGVQEIPINLSDAYFSKNIIVNDVTVNPNWNLIQNLLKNKTNFKGNPYKKYPKERVDRFIKSIKKNNDSTINVLNTKQPNIVFILLESWSADMIESLGGLNGVTPNFNELEKDGLLFTNFYSNGFKSDQAMTAIFSSFPSFPFVSIINQTDKARKLPALNKSLVNYNSSYFFGGQLTYGNIKGYLLSQGFDLVKDGANYSDFPSGALGVHDEFMFNSFKDELKYLPEPFMSTLFTISSHSPYDFPAEHKLSYNSKHDKYVNSVAYTDKCLGSFFQSIKNESWYKNTLFVILADHSHNSPIKRRLAEKAKFRIPMLWFGEVLKNEYKGVKCNNFASHLDVGPTILNQMDIHIDNDYFGVDIFSSDTGFIFYSFGTGYGLIKNNENVAFSLSYNKFLESNFNDSIIVSECEMFLQYSFEKYINY